MAATETLLALREKVMTESGTFQVSLSGLDVGLQTWDDALKSDGWADEAFLAAGVTAVENGKAMYTNKNAESRNGRHHGFPFQPSSGHRRRSVNWGPPYIEIGRLPRRETRAGVDLLHPSHCFRNGRRGIR
jgi:hypothetical protein